MLFGYFTRWSRDRRQSSPSFFISVTGFSVRKAARCGLDDLSDKFGVPCLALAGHKPEK